MADVRNIVADALRELGVLAAGEVATADDALSGLAALNRLVDQWAAERLMIYQQTRTVGTVTSGTQTYTVGTGGVVNVARPVYLDWVRFQDTSESPTQEYPLTELTDDAWAQVAQKTLTATLPIYYYYNPTFATGTISLWPVPTSTTLQLVVYAPQQVAEFAGLNTAISLPPGYRRMLVKNLALEMAPSYERPAQPELIQQAIESKTVVKRANTRIRDLSFDPGVLMNNGRYFDINTGT